MWDPGRALDCISVYIDACHLEARVALMWASGKLYLKEWILLRERIFVLKAKSLHEAQEYTRMRGPP